MATYVVATMKLLEMHIWASEKPRKTRSYPINKNDAY